MSGRRVNVVRYLTIALLASVSTGCNWVLNEAFIYDVAPIVAEEQSGVEPGW